MENIKFKLIEVPSIDEVRTSINKCEGKHKQQAVYSTYMDAMTQICFDCKKIVTNYKTQSVIQPD